MRDAVSSTAAEAVLARVRIDAARVLQQSCTNAHVVAELLLAASAVAEPSEVVEACRRAGEASRAALAHEDAARFFGAALDRLEADADLNVRLSLTLRHAQALSDAWRWGEASPVFEAAADLAHELGDVIVQADAISGAFGVPENYRWGDPLPARLDRAINDLGKLDEDRAAALLAAKAVGEWDQWHLEEANDLLQRARSLATTASTRSYVMRCHLRSWFDPLQVDDRLRVAEELVELGNRSSDIGVQAYGHRWAAISGFDAGDLTEVERHLDALLFLARQERDLWHEWFALTRRVTLEAARGRFDAVDVALTASAELAAVLETPYVRSVQAGVGFLVGSVRGRLISSPAGADTDTNLQIQMGMAATADAPETSLARGALTVLHPRSLAGRMVAVLAAPLALRARDRELAQLTVEALRGLEGGFAVVPPGAAFLGSIRQRLGYCHLALGAPEAALAEFDAAAVRERKIGAVACAIRSEWLAGHAQRVLGNHAIAEQRQRPARHAAAEIGMGSLSEVPLPGSHLEAADR